MSTVTKPIALDETLQDTNTALSLLGKDTTLQSIVTALASIGVNTVGNLASLVTTDKTSLVGAVNEVAGDVDDIDEAKADKVDSATSGNLASLNASGNLADSGWASDKTTTAVSGNPISISGLKSNQLAIDPIITFEPIQAGSGDPSPSNVRAISGRDQIGILSANGSDPTAQGYEVITDLTLQFGQTIYGGTLDLKNGVLRVERWLEVYDGSSDENWSQGTYTGGSRFLISPNLAVDESAYGNVISNYLLTIYTDIQIVGGIRVISNNRLDTYWDSSLASNITELRAYLSSNPLQVCYKLATPYTIQLTPHEISLLKDVANVSIADAGASMSFSYHNGEVASLGDVEALGQTVNELWDHINDVRELFTYTFNGTATWQSALYDISQKLKLLSWADMRKLQLQYNTDNRIFNIVKINNSDWQFSTTCLDGIDYIDIFVVTIDTNLSGNKSVMIRVKNDSSVTYTWLTTVAPSNDTVLKVLLT